MTETVGTLKIIGIPLLCNLYATSDTERKQWNFRIPRLLRLVVKIKWHLTWTETQCFRDATGECKIKPNAALSGAATGGWPYLATTFVVCPDCGNKRCPKATDHLNACTGSNEANQTGSVFGGVCIYPDCHCPFDAPADPNWCAKGLPHLRAPNAPIKRRGGQPD